MKTAHARTIALLLLAPVVVASSCPKPKKLDMQRYVFVANNMDGTISAFSADPLTERLIPRSYVKVNGVAMDIITKGGVLYAALSGTGGIADYNIEPSGALTLRNTTPAGTNARGMVLGPGGNVYVASQTSSDVTVLGPDATTGFLVVRQTLPSAGNPVSIALNRSGNNVHVLNGAGNTVTSYRIDATGNLAAAGAAAVMSQPSVIAAGLDLVYVAGPGVVAGFEVDPATGTLTRRDTDPNTPGIQDLTVCPMPSSLAISVDGNFVFVGCSGAIVTISSASSTSNFQVVSQAFAVANPGEMVLDPSGRWLTVTGASGNEVVTMSLDRSSGKLTRLHSTRARVLPVAITQSAGPTATGFTPRIALVGGNTETHLRAYVIDSVTGALTQTGTPGGNFVSAIALHPRLPVAYAVGIGLNQDIVERFQLDLAAGTATLVAPNVPTGGLPIAITVEPSGRFAYLAHQSGNSIHMIWRFSIDQASGALTRIPGVTFNPGIEPSAIAVDPLGRWLYVANKTTRTISAWQIDPATGALTAVPGMPFATGVNQPVSIAVHTTSRSLYVAGSDFAKSLAIDSLTGALGTPSAAGLGVPATTLTVYPSGQFRIMASASGLSSGTLNPDNGTFTGPLGAAPGFPAGFNTTAATAEASGRFGYAAAGNGAFSDGRVIPVGLNPGTGYVMSYTTGTPAPGMPGPRAVVVRATAW